MGHASFSFTIEHTDTSTNARLGIIHTPHGDIHTPAFVPVGTQATVKSLSSDDLETLNVKLFFVNTYHMYLRPGMEVIQTFGGLHRFMHWDHPIITDSGGFQVFSLARERVTVKDGEQGTSLVKISDDGVEFTSHWDGSKHVFTPELSMQLQHTLGSDIHIAFDDCTPYPVTHERAKISMEQTHRWAIRSLDAHAECQRDHVASGEPYQALYGSVQGSVFEDLRIESAKTIGAMDFDGIAIGGVSVGETKQQMADVLAWVMPYLPEAKPKHLLGVGEIDDIVHLIAHGVDTFDCVQATREARMGYVYITPTSNKGPWHIDIQKKEYSRSTEPLDASCSCEACRQYSRAYIHHLFRVHELLAYRLVSLHNITIINAWVERIRHMIQDGTFGSFAKEWGVAIPTR